MLQLTHINGEYTLSNDNSIETIPVVYFPKINQVGEIIVKCAKFNSYPELNDFINILTEHYNIPFAIVGKKEFFCYNNIIEESENTPVCEIEEYVKSRSNVIDIVNMRGRIYYMENGVLKTTFKAHNEDGNSKYQQLYMAYYIIENGKPVIKKGYENCFNNKQTNEFMAKLNDFIGIGIKICLVNSKTYYFISDKIDKIMHSNDAYDMGVKFEEFVGDDIKDESLIKLFSKL